MPSNKNAKQPEGRTRDVRLWWERNPDGAIIPRNPPPLGNRTAEGFVWGHKLSHLFWIQRIPGVNAMTIWSRSMLKEFGEGYDEHEWDEPLVGPRVLRPWPVLKLPEGHPSPRNPPLGAIDAGCECEHAEQVSYQIRKDEVDERPAGDVPDASSAADGASSGDKTHAAQTQDVDVQMIDANAESDDKEQVQQQDVAGSEGAADKAMDADSEGSDPKKKADDKKAAEATPPPRDPLFSVKGLPKLEEFIPDEYFPDELLVHDPDNTTLQSETPTKPIRYLRCHPVIRRAINAKTRVAHLYLSKENRFGAGNHSYVYRAPLTLPAPLSAHSPTGQVTVAAKLAYSKCTARNLLRNEGEVYNSFPKWIQEEYCGYNIVPQCRFPVPATAIVPKFFGYYLPIDEDGDMAEVHHPNCDERNPCTVNVPSPILLMEECGTPVEPSEFTIDQRTECFSLILRLHYMELIQGSFYVRNIMIQPGPLTAPPEKRTLDTPSFRIIDFGRGASWDTWRKSPSMAYYRGGGGDSRLEFLGAVGDEVVRARSELLVEDFGF
ncbi:hypothetical protein GY45DRAFT_841765 [Cubamyces sp. BRFM 1775]|nr:hypothetical protein GY45DRAFT_841765 [Cubamyces sp. BRFM 1775]